MNTKSCKERAIFQHSGIMDGLLPRLDITRVTVVKKIIPKEEAESDVRVGVSEAEEILTRDPACLTFELAVNRHIKGTAN